MKNNFDRLPLIIFFLFCFGYFLLMLRHISTAYLDFGDGNYLYISRRLLDGLVIYKDILSPQPPMHLFLGALLLRLGDIIENPLLIVRIFTILLRISHAILIYLIAWKIFGDKCTLGKKNTTPNFIPAFAGIIYLFLPIGFWWSRGFQPQPLQIFWMLLALYYFIRLQNWSIILAGIFTSLAVFTNMTATPYMILTVLFLSIYRRDLLKWYLLTIGLIWVIGGLFLQWWTSGMFLQNTILDQVGTYPKENTLQYMWGKIVWVGGIILYLEGLLIAAALAGLFIYYWKNRIGFFKNKPSELYIFFYMLTILGSFIFATKGGTVDYIFTIGEPAVALFSVFAIFKIMEKIYFPHFIIRLIIIIILLIGLSYPGLKQNQSTLRGYNYELPPEKMEYIVNLIHDHADEDELIFAPGYFAFLANRTIVGEFSEQFIWFMKYINWLIHRQGNEYTMKYIENIGQKMMDRKVKIIFINLERGRGQQTGQIKPFRQAVELYYQPIGQIFMRNETLTVFIPRE